MRDIYICQVCGVATDEGVGLTCPKCGEEYALQLEKEYLEEGMDLEGVSDE